MVAAALAALDPVGCQAMLTVPVAVRRMIDHGFSGGDGLFIDRYFAMLIAIGLVLALASAGRFYAVNWLGGGLQPRSSARSRRPARGSPPGPASRRWLGVFAR